MRSEPLLILISGGPPNQCRITGTPSLSEVPSGGARALWLLWGFSKVTRRKGGTLSRRYRSNGYVLIALRQSGAPPSRRASGIVAGFRAVTGASSLATGLWPHQSCVAQASRLPQASKSYSAAWLSTHITMRSEPLLILISGAPLNHAGRNSILIWGVNRQGCRFSRPAPWMARGGGPPNQCRIAGTPSLSEVPSGGARAFCLLLRFSKVSRRKGGTLSRRYRSNGYVLIALQQSGARPLAEGQLGGRRLPGRHGSKLPRHQVSTWQQSFRSGNRVLDRERAYSDE